MTHGTVFMCFEFFDRSVDSLINTLLSVTEVTEMQHNVTHCCRNEKSVSVALINMWTWKLCIKTLWPLYWSVNIFWSDVLIEWVQICDFGLAKWHTYATRSTSVNRSRRGGTVTNIPPERWRDIHTPRTPKYDVYGFGIMLWELITEQNAFAPDGQRQGWFLYCDNSFQLFVSYILICLTLLQQSFSRMKTFGNHMKMPGHMQESGPVLGHISCATWVVTKFMFIYQNFVAVATRVVLGQVLITSLNCQTAKTLLYLVYTIYVFLMVSGLDCAGWEFH